MALTELEQYCPFLPDPSSLMEKTNTLGELSETELEQNCPICSSSGEEQHIRSFRAVFLAFFNKLDLATKGYIVLIEMGGVELALSSSTEALITYWNTRILLTLSILHFLSWECS